MPPPQSNQLDGKRYPSNDLSLRLCVSLVSFNFDRTLQLPAPPGKINRARHLIRSVTDDPLYHLLLPKLISLIVNMPPPQSSQPSGKRYPSNDLSLYLCVSVVSFNFDPALQLLAPPGSQPLDYKCY